MSPENGMQQDDSAQINISDVIDVIEQTDPEVRGMFNPNPINGGGLHQPLGSGGPNRQPQQQPSNTIPMMPNDLKNNPTNAYVEIIEQPAPKAIRFRYECEGRSAGSIPGENSTPENKTYPAIKIRNYKGRAVVVVSCVTKDHPYRPHPHRLVGKEGCKKGVCTMEINNETMSLTFSNLGIQCVKKRDIEEALRLREDIRVDPFRTGFSHRNQPASIDLNAVRLCFQVFIGGDQPPRFNVPLTPVVSNPIYDKKGTNELIICKMSDCSADVRGGREIILLCEKVAKEDIRVRFYEVDYNDHVTWEAYGDFNHTNVHKQVAISFKVPAYHNLNIDKSAFVNVQLKRPSDDICSEPLQFEYIPCPEYRLRKSKRSPDHETLKDQQLSKYRKQESMPGMSSMLDPKTNGGYLHDPMIKQEPRDRSPFHLTRGPQETPSPQPISPATPLTPGDNFGSPTYIPIHSQTTSSVNTLIRYNFEDLNENGELPQQGANWNIPTYHTTFNIHQYQKQIGLNNTMSTYNNFENLNHHNNLNATNHAGSALNHATNNHTEPNDSMNISLQDSFSSSQLLLSTLQTLPNFNSTELNGILTNSQFEGQTPLMNDQARMEQEQENMTDSFNRLTTETIKEIGDLNQYRIDTTRK